MILLYEYAWILLLKNCDICSALGMIVLLSDRIYSNKNYSLKTSQTLFHKSPQFLENIFNNSWILQISSFYNSLILKNKLFSVIFLINYMNSFACTNEKLILGICGCVLYFKTFAIKLCHGRSFC